MRVDVLGPVRVTSQGARIASPRTKERALLAALAVRADHAVPLETLSTALWGDHPPQTAARTLQAHVAHLRHDLGGGVIVREGFGYRLALPPEAVDAVRLEGLVVSGETALRDGDAACAGRWFREAEALWRGEPLTDLADTPDRQAHVHRLRGLWLQAREGRIRAELDLGHHLEVLGELRRLVSEQPLREPNWALLILALYRSGDQLGALRAYREVRDLLERELDVQPSPDLQRLRDQILRQDRQLDLRPPPPPFVVPAPMSSFVGRAGQVESVAAAVTAERLVTLSGPAGVGKSRLAQESVRRARSEFADGIWWVDLTVCSDGAGILDGIAQVLGVAAPPGLPLLASLKAFLRNRELLLVLDNCEHVVDALSEHVLALLGAAPRLRVLATSRVPLHLSGEVLWAVRPLEVPDAGSDDSAIEECDSVALFRARLGRPLDDVGSLAEAGHLCRALDGMPLALELVAVRAQRLTLGEISHQLVAEVARASRPVARPSHHADVMRAIDWSYSQLAAKTQHVFDWLSVFPGEFDLSALEAVAAAIPGVTTTSVDRHLARLLDTSMIETRRVAGITRYRLLFVTREFAHDRLQSRDETSAATRAFADHYRQLAVAASVELNGPHPGAWLRRLRRELTNLRAAVEWSRDHEPAPRSLAFAPALGRVVWLTSVDLAADAKMLRDVVQAASAESDQDLLAWGWQSLVTTTYMSGDLAGALEACGRSSALFERTGNQAGMATVHWHWGAAQLLAAGNLTAADRTLRRGRALAREADVPTVEAWCLAHLVQRAYFAGAVTDETLHFHVDAEGLADPEDEVLQAHLTMNRAGLHIASGDLGAAVDAARLCEKQAHSAGISTYEQAGQLLLGVSLLGLGHRDEALATALRAARLAIDAGNRMQLGLALQQLARTADAEDAVRAAALWGAATARSPVLPAFERVLFPIGAATALGDRFEVEVGAGRRLAAEDALDLAIG
jgi:predicted ATPase/DNA-binding SARP family transcriptional activator